MKKFFSLFLVLGLIIGLSACGSSDEDTDIKDDEETEKENANETDELTEEEINTELQSISIWVIGDYWNEGLVDLTWYISSGTDATGKEMDVNLTLEKYNDYLSKAEEYNTFITSLDKETYKDVIESWERMYTEMKSIDTYIQQGVEPNSNPEWTTDLFTQYRNDFSEKVNIVNGVE